MIPSKLLESIFQQSHTIKGAIFVVIISLAFIGCQKDGSTDSGNPESMTLTIDTAFVTISSLKLQWTKSVAGDFQRYDIHISTYSSFIPTDTNRYGLILIRDTTNLTVVGLASSTVYYFRVRVITSGGKIPTSNEASPTTKGPPGFIPVDASVRFIHAARKLPSVEVSVQSVVRDILNFEAASPYRTYPAGTRLMSVMNNGTTLDSEAVAFLGNAKASVFILDKPSISSRRFSFLAERYNFSPPGDPTAALVRCANASLGLDTAALRLGGPAGTVVGGFAPYGKAGLYQVLSPQLATFTVTGHNDTTGLGSPLSVNLSINKRYTIVVLDTMPTPRLKSFIDD